MNFQTDVKHDTYVAELEDFVLRIDHAVGPQTRALDYGGNAFGLKGNLQYANGTIIDPCDDYIGDPLTPKVRN
jgi:hypothetical protein